MTLDIELIPKTDLCFAQMWHCSYSLCNSLQPLMFNYICSTVQWSCAHDFAKHKYLKKHNNAIFLCIRKLL